MKKASLILVAVVFSATAFAQNVVKTTTKNENTGAKTEKKTEMRSNGTSRSTTMHKTGRTEAGQHLHKAHMKVKKAV